MKKYYIYHIKGIKIGCATQPKQRVNRQGFSDYEILEEHSCIYTVSFREIELQKQYGYKVDNVPYWKTYLFGKSGRNAHTDESYKKWQDGYKKWLEQNKEKHRINAIKGGKTTGPKLAKRNVESGWISNLGKKMSTLNNQIQICPHCGITARGVGYHRWHGTNCKNYPTL